MEQNSPEFIDPRSTPYVPIRSRGELPHLYKEDGSYFVTFRLLDAVAHKCTATVKNPRHKLNAEEVAKMSESPLRLGSCVLERPEIAALVQDTLRFFDGKRYNLAAWCIMPNHVHVIFNTLQEHTPKDILHSWKSFISHKVNSILGRHGPLWERESFDHLIRSLGDYERFVHYIEQNPIVAGLCISPQQWPYSHCGAGVPPA